METATKQIQKLLEHYSQQPAYQLLNKQIQTKKSQCLKMLGEAIIEFLLWDKFKLRGEQIESVKKVCFQTLDTWEV